MLSHEMPLRLSGPNTWESVKSDFEAWRDEQREQLAGEYPTLADLGFHIIPSADDDEHEDDEDDVTFIDRQIYPWKWKFDALIAAVFELDDATRDRILTRAKAFEAEAQEDDDDDD